jgi:outer membrane protein OmpA-like peptidoglycan-associated protein
LHASMPASSAPDLSTRKGSTFQSSPQEFSSPVYADAAPVINRASDASNAAASWTVAGDLAFYSNVGDTRISGMRSSQFVKLFRFIVEDAKGTSIPSEVMLVNFEKIKKLASFQPGENIAIKGTKPEQMVTFVCDVLGFHQETRMFNLDHLSRGKDATKNEQGIWEVRIKLKKLGVHEIGVMNKTIFHKDAAILEASSRAELEELVTLMKNNPGYKIILHSHCNPGANRLLKIPAAEDNYFNLEDAVEKNGSDKMLTKKRAELVRTYLINHGIDKKRIGVVAWGSLEPVVRSGSEEDYVNDRIELELAGE